VSTVRSCRLAQFTRAAWYRKSTARDQRALALCIRDIAHVRPRFGYQRITVMLRVKVGLYRLQGLQVRMRVRRRKHMCLHRGPVPLAMRAHERWSMDFVHDALFGGQAFRMLTVVDQYSRPESVDRGGLRALRPQCSGRVGQSGRSARRAALDHGRSRHRIHVQSIRGLGVATRSEARLHTAGKTE